MKEEKKRDGIILDGRALLDFINTMCEEYAEAIGFVIENSIIIISEKFDGDVRKNKMAFFPKCTCDTCKFARDMTIDAFKGKISEKDFLERVKLLLFDHEGSIQ